jgi:L-asparaginase type II
MQRRLGPVHAALRCVHRREPLPPAHCATAATAELPRVVVIGTGGTIAGEQHKPGTLGGYKPGVRAVGSLVSALPAEELAKHAAVDSEQFLNVASTEVTPAHWVQLARRVNALLAGPSPPAGVVVTHGTDRLEETAFWLYLTVASNRPVVVVGAQRPATGLSPDGPMNLLSAIRVAAAPQSAGLGVSVVMDDRIMSARDCRKLYPRPGGFGVGDMGMLGALNSDGPAYFYAPLRRHGAATAFAPPPAPPSGEAEGAPGFALPKVELVFSYPGGDGPMLWEDTVGVVVATTSGFGPGERAAWDAVRRRGVVVVVCFPSGDHPSPEYTERRQPPPEGEAPEARKAREERDALPPMVRAQHLLPAKARILLMCALAVTQDPVEVQALFAAY